MADEEIPDGETARFHALENTRVGFNVLRPGLRNIDGALYAIEDVCSHDGGELAGGDVYGFEVECPRHGARFDLRTGAVTKPPAYEPIASFPVREEGGAIWTRDDR